MLCSFYSVDKTGAKEKQRAMPTVCLCVCVHSLLTNNFRLIFYSVDSTKTEARRHSFKNSYSLYINFFHLRKKMDRMPVTAQHFNEYSIFWHSVQSFNFEILFFFYFLFLSFVTIDANKRPVIDFLIKFYAKICLHTAPSFVVHLSRTRCLSMTV